MLTKVPITDLMRPKCGNMEWNAEYFNYVPSLFFEKAGTKKQKNRNKQKSNISIIIIMLLGKCEKFYKSVQNI